MRNARYSFIGRVLAAGGVLAGGALALLGGCPRPEQVNQAARATDCDSGAHPCALAKVSADVLQRGEELSVAVRTMLEGGASAADALAFVQAQEGVVEAAGDNKAVRFRLNGGRYCWVLGPEALGIDLTALPAVQDETSLRAVQKPVMLPAVQKSVSLPAVQKPRDAARVVGDDPDAKNALILAPFEYQFREHDEGAAVASLLGEARGYEGRVTYLENNSKAAKNVGIEQFKGWENYDVVHVSSHGSSMCDDDYCVNVILTGDRYESAAELGGITDPGVNTIHAAGVDRGLLALTPEFFRHYYGGGLENTLIFFNACKSYGAGPNDGGSLSNALLGPGSAYFGWTEVVHADVAYDAAMSIFRNMVDFGIPAFPALAELGDRAIDRYTNKHGAPIEAWLLVDRAEGGDLRAREVITLEHPQGGELTTDPKVRVIGQADDGQVDRVPFAVLVEGIEEFEAEFASVVVTVDGHNSEPIAVSTGERTGSREYRVKGEIEYIDLKETEKTVEMHAEIKLPEGGISEHSATATLTAQQGPEIWIGETTSDLQLILGDGVVSVTATIELQQTEYSIGKPTKRLSVTGGKMLWRRSGTVSTLMDGDCSYANGPVEVPIQPGDGEIMIDMTTTPPSYEMHGFTNGPEVRCAENCGDYSFATSADGVWAPAITDFGQFFVSGDGTIQGSLAENHRTFAWSFRKK